MSYTILQESQLASRGWWTWQVWVEASSSELDAVTFIEYTLHPTFPNPVRIIQDRASKFLLKSGGWGEFMIYAKVNLRDGTIVPLRHWLSLGSSVKFINTPSEPEMDGIKGQSAKSVFLSAAIADEPFADALQEALEEKGYKVLRLGDDPDLPPRASINAVVHQADAAVLVVSDSKSPWMRLELDAIRSRKLPLLPILIGPESVELPEKIQHFQSIRLKPGEHLITEAGAVASRIGDSLRLA